MAITLGAVVTMLASGIFDTRFGFRLLEEITGALGAILFGPISAIALTLAYYDQRVRSEAFDIEHMMSLMGVPKMGAQESLPSTPPPPPIV